MTKTARKLHEDKRGSLMVETTLSFVMFVGVLASIMSLINLVTLHDRVQYALTQIASEVATYSYLYEATNLKGAHDGWKDHADSATADVQAVIDGIGTIAGMPNDLANAGSLSDISDTLDNAANAGQTIRGEISHPKEFVQKIISGEMDKLFEDAKSGLLGGICFGLSPKYLKMDASSVDGGQLEADAFLRSFGVIDGMKGLDFSASTLFSDTEKIDVVVQYDVNFKFALLPLPFTKIHMVQRAVTSGWCGDGGHYE